MRKNLLATSAVVALVVALASYLIPSTAAVWDGHFRLTVDVHPRSNTAISEVSYALFSRNVTDYLTNRLAEDPGQETWKRLEPLGGGSYLATIPCSGRECLGIKYGYVEPFRFIVFRVTCGDAKTQLVAAQIPKGRGPRGLQIETP